MNYIDISVNICTYNRSDMLCDTLNSLMCQQTDGMFSYEIVIVDDGSADETPSLVRELSAHSPIPIRYLREQRVGIAAARNRGVMESRGEWIAFIDDDEIAETCWLKELLYEAKRSGAVCVGGPCIAHFLCAPPDPRMKSILRVFGYNKAMATPNSTMRWYEKFVYYDVPGTGNALIKRDVFREIGLFDATLPCGEDMDCFRRLRKAGFKISNTPRAQIGHMIPASRLDPVYLKRHSKLGGRTLARLDKNEWGYSVLALLSIARMSYLLFRLPQLIVGLVKRDNHSVLDHAVSCMYSLSYISESISIFIELFTSSKVVSR